MKTPHLGKRLRQYVLVLHVTLSVGWLGAGAANLVVALAIVVGHADVTPLAGSTLIHLIDNAVVIPCAFGALVTGILLSVCTKWGLTQYWWVLTKFVLTIIVIVASTFGIGLWVETHLERIPAGQGMQAGMLMVGLATGNLAAFVFMTWLSVLKPWGRTPWAALSPRRRRAGVV